MASTKAEKEASIRWQKKNYSRIPLDVPPDEHARLKEIAKAAGKTLGGWIKEAIAEKIERDGIRSAPQETETAEEPEALAAEPEPSGPMIKHPETAAATPPDLEAVDLQRLLTDVLYQLDIIDIYGKDQAQKLLDLARSKNSK